VALGIGVPANPADPDVELKGQWVEICARDDKAPEVMGEVLAMTGLHAVKECMFDQYHRIRLAQRQNDGKGSAGNYNSRFEGNPGKLLFRFENIGLVSNFTKFSGTGKTTVAKAYSKFLKELGVLPEDAVLVETSGANLIYSGVSISSTKLDEV
jgi:hypothetical protein